MFIGSLYVPSFSYCIAFSFVIFKVASLLLLAAVLFNVISVFITRFIPLLISVTKSVCSPCIFTLIIFSPFLFVITSYDSIEIPSLYNKFIVLISKFSISLGNLISTVGF